MRKIFWIFLILYSWNLSAQNNNIKENLNKEEDKKIKKTDTINQKAIKVPYVNDDFYAFKIDSIHRHNIFKSNKYTSDIKKLNIHNFPLDSVPVWPESVIKKRIEELNKKTPIQLVHNDVVQAYINLYANRRRGLISRVLGLAQLYYPVFEEELDKENLPLELKHLSVIESALTNNIKSSAGAVGLWQFMYRTAVYMGLNIDSYVDERQDPIKSTQTAVQYLKYLHSLYNDWFMALAAYNAGPGTVNKAIRKSGGKTTYWEVRPFLPAETRSYVPAFIAAVYIMNHASDHNIYPLHPRFTHRDLDTVVVRYPVTFKQISDVLNIPEDDIMFLNPQYKKSYIPVIGPKDNKTLVLPYEIMGQYILNEEYISNFGKNVEPVIEEVKNEEVANKEFYHVVKSGESLLAISKKHSVTVAEIQSWNNLKSSNIHPGQKLKIISNGVTTETSLNNNSTSNVSSSSSSGGKSFLYHTVKSGETLYAISNKYKGVDVNQILQLNSLSKNSVIRPGMKLKIKKI
jgi:membrane-bound lytic murein transglycosylase D